MILLFLLSCVPVCEERCLSLYEGCELPDIDISAAETCDMCDDLTDRAADDWAKCEAATELSADVATYGWDDAACLEVADECGAVPN